MLGKLCRLAKHCGQKLALTLLQHDPTSQPDNSRPKNEGAFVKCTSAVAAAPLALTRNNTRPAMLLSDNVAPPLVTVVEIEKNLAHIATMAGMASSHVGRRDRRGHVRCQIAD